MAVLADRLPPGGRARSVPVSFPRRRGGFPEGPFRLAALLGYPVVTMIALRAGPRRYRVDAAFAQRTAAPAQRAERSSRATRRHSRTSLPPPAGAHRCSGSTSRRTSEQPRGAWSHRSRSSFPTRRRCSGCAASSHTRGTDRSRSRRRRARPLERARRAGVPATAPLKSSLRSAPRRTRGSPRLRATPPQRGLLLGAQRSSFAPGASLQIDRCSCARTAAIGRE